MSNTNDAPTGEMRFFDNYVPPFDDGDYEITVSQTLVGSGEHEANQSFSSTQRFTVTGPRFAIDPADIHREFPAPNSQGSFAADLPHIVLRKRALPWERNVFGDTDDATRTPWLALLVLQPDEILEPIVGSNAPPNDGGANPARSSSILLSQLTQAQPGVLLPDVTIQPYESPDQTAVAVIDLTPAAFASLIPARQDLRYYAHGRLVEIDRKSTTVTVEHPASQIDDGKQWFSVIIGSRRPSPPSGEQPGQLNIVHLVSLEGLTDYVRASEGDPPVSLPAGTTRVRMVSLASWSFSCLPERGQSFASLMNGLVDDGQASADDLFLRAPTPELPAGASADETFVHAALSAGYVARRWATRQGEQTFAWYRGPFVASLPQRLAQQNFELADQASVYDQTRGLFDHSYAAAFEIGRLAALHSGSFGPNLLRWRRKLRGLASLLATRLGVDTLRELTASEPEQVRAVLRPNLASRAFLDHLAEGFTASRGSARAQPTTLRSGSRAHVAQLGSPIDALRGALREPAVKQVIAELDADELTPILEFLAGLYLLRGVPFNLLVPDSRMLPVESIRFFYVDRNWLDAMIDGALSIGLQSTLDSEIQRLMLEVIEDALLALVHTLRDRLLGIDDPQPGDLGDGPFAGMLMRSAAVSGWPGLEVEAAHGRDGDNPTEPMQLLRMDHLASDVLLCLFPAVPAWVAVSEPQEGLHFGFESDDAVYLRQLSGEQVGFLVEPQRSVSATFDSARMLQLQDLLAKLGAGLDTTLGPADLAVELVAVPERFIYQTR
ncbi:MAG: hypothetical protein R6X02_32835 [Enhygromyxa sp.]